MTSERVFLTTGKKYLSKKGSPGIDLDVAGIKEVYIFSGIPNDIVFICSAEFYELLRLYFIVCGLFNDVLHIYFYSLFLYIVGTLIIWGKSVL